MTSQDLEEFFEQFLNIKFKSLEGFQDDGQGAKQCYVIFEDDDPYSFVDALKRGQGQEIIDKKLLFDVFIDTTASNQPPAQPEPQQKPAPPQQDPNPPRSNSNSPGGGGRFKRFTPPANIKQRPLPQQTQRLPGKRSDPFGGAPPRKTSNNDVPPSHSSRPPPREPKVFVRRSGSNPFGDAKPVDRKSSPHDISPRNDNRNQFRTNKTSSFKNFKRPEAVDDDDVDDDFTTAPPPARTFSRPTPGNSDFNSNFQRNAFNRPPTNRSNQYDRGNRIGRGRGRDNRGGYNNRRGGYGGGRGGGRGFNNRRGRGGDDFQRRGRRGRGRGPRGGAATTQTDRWKTADTWRKPQKQQKQPKEKPVTDDDGFTTSRRTRRKNQGNRGKKKDEKSPKTSTKVANKFKGLRIDDEE